MPSSSDNSFANSGSLYLDEAKWEERARLKARTKVELLPPIRDHGRERAVVVIRSIGIILSYVVGNKQDMKVGGKIQSQIYVSTQFKY